MTDLSLSGSYVVVSLKLRRYALNAGAIVALFGTVLGLFSLFLGYGNSMMPTMAASTMIPTVLVLGQQIERIERGDEVEDEDEALRRGFVAPLLLGFLVVVAGAQIVVLLMAKSA